MSLDRANQGYHIGVEVIVVLLMVGKVAGGE